MVNGNYEVDVTVNTVRVDLYLKDSQKLVWKISSLAGCYFCRMQSWAGGAFCLRFILCLRKPDSDSRGWEEEVGRVRGDDKVSWGLQRAWNVGGSKTHIRWWYWGTLENSTLLSPNSTQEHHPKLPESSSLPSTQSHRNLNLCGNWNPVPSGDSADKRLCLKPVPTATGSQSRSQITRYMSEHLLSFSCSTLVFWVWIWNVFHRFML